MKELKRCVVASLKIEKDLELRGTSWHLVPLLPWENQDKIAIKPPRVLIVSTDIKRQTETTKS